MAKWSKTWSSTICDLVSGGLNLSGVFCIFFQFFQTLRANSGFQEKIGNKIPFLYHYKSFKDMIFIGLNHGVPWHHFAVFILKLVFSSDFFIIFVRCLIFLGHVKGNDTLFVPKYVLNYIKKSLKSKITSGFYHRGSSHFDLVG